MYKHIHSCSNNRFIFYFLLKRRNRIWYVVGSRDLGVRPLGVRLHADKVGFRFMKGGIFFLNLEWSSLFFCLFFGRWEWVSRYGPGCESMMGRGRTVEKVPFPP